MKPAVLVLIVLLVLPASVVFCIIQPGPSGVVAALELPDGSQYMVTQRCNWSPEPYTVSFYMRPRGGSWGWCYIDHQSRRWHDGKLAWDPANDVITLTEGGEWRAALDRKRSVFAIGEAKPSREVSAPQSFLEPGYPMP